MPVADPHDPISLLLAGRYPDPTTGELLRAETRSVVIEDSLVGAEAELLVALGLGRRLALIADAHTFAALGERVERAVAGRFAVQRIVLDGAFDADVETIARLGAVIERGVDAIVAVGSGTINDLGKMVALERGIPQVVFATAPSMNGYTSLSASITSQGVKRSVRAATPVGVFFDLGVLAAAPPPLIRAGLGDSSCRPTAQADWLLAHLLVDWPYREAPFALLAADEPALFAQAPELLAGDLGALRRLVRTLVLSGFGMTICGGSYPASQGEHLLSHYLEMQRPTHPERLHGEQIGVCALAMARLQAQVLARDTPPRLQASTLTRDEVLARFGPIAGESCWAEVAPKLLTAARAEELTARLARDWDAIRARLMAVSLEPQAMQAMLGSAGAPTTPGELGWSNALLDEALHHAREIRNRYTFLDLAADVA
ncbi:MAG: iron-containing alcohol dehydrogenase [Deltaproteobacteria bacterium]|nr:iron-containing alcohol dehydrogenase [Deltaproteobacteria bacterium]